MRTTEIKFRCSSLGYIMTDPQKKSETLSETAKTHCIDVFTSWMYGRREEVYSKYLEKGNAVEEDAITLLSLLSRNIYFKNTANIQNEYITGTPDLFLKSGDKIEVVEDIKSSWDIFTFLRSKHKDINKQYYWQLQGYIWLTHAIKARLRYCLVNSTADLIDDEKRKLAYAMRVMDNDTDPAYIEQCKQIERNMIYDIRLFTSHYPYYQFHNDVNKWEWDIPKEERMFTIEIDRNDTDIERIKQRVKDCRAYISESLMPNVSQLELA